MYFVCTASSFSLPCGYMALTPHIRYISGSDRAALKTLIEITMEMAGVKTKNDRKTQIQSEARDLLWLLFPDQDLTLTAIQCQETVVTILTGPHG